VGHCRHYRQASAVGRGLDADESTTHSPSSARRACHWYSTSSGRLRMEWLVLSTHERASGCIPAAASCASSACSSAGDGGPAPPRVPAPMCLRRAAGGAGGAAAGGAALRAAAGGAAGDGGGGAAAAGGAALRAAAGGAAGVAGLGAAGAGAGAAGGALADGSGVMRGRWMEMYLRLPGPAPASCPPSGPLGAAPAGAALHRGRGVAEGAAAGVLRRQQRGVVRIEARASMLAGLPGASRQHESVAVGSINVCTLPRDVGRTRARAEPVETTPTDQAQKGARTKRS